MGTPLLCWGVLSFFLHVPHLSPNLPLPFTIAFGVHHAEEGKQWTLNDTREWLEKHGMRFSTTALRRFINIYVTYMKPNAYDMDLENKSLTELCEEIEREIESLFVPDSLPAQVFEALFPGLESPKPDEGNLDPVTTSLQTLYMKINQQLEQITIPNIKNIEIFWALFPALEPPKDKKPLVSSSVRHPPVVVCRVKPGGDIGGVKNGYNQRSPLPLIFRPPGGLNRD